MWRKEKIKIRRKINLVYNEKKVETLRQRYPERLNFIQSVRKRQKK